MEAEARWVKHIYTDGTTIIVEWFEALDGK
jgi:hypothetical protein